MSDLKRLAGETVIYGMGSILPRILNFLLLAPYFTRILQESSYGIHGIMYSFSALLMVFYTYRMETAFFRFGSRKDDFKSAFTSSSVGVFAVSAFFTIALLLFREPIAGILTAPEDQRYIVYFSFIIFFDAISALAFAKLRLQNRPIKFASLKLFNVVLNILIILLLLEIFPWLEQNGSVLVPGWFDANQKLDHIFIANLIASGVIFLVIASEYRDLGRKFDIAIFKKMFLYALPLIVVGVAGVINQLVDRYLVKELLPGDLMANLSQSGIYNACVKIAVLMLLFTTAFNYAAEPFFFKNAHRKDAPEIYARVGQAYLLTASVVFLVITLYLDIFQLLIGERFREGLTIVPILLMAYLFLGLYYNFSIWYKVTDKTYFGAIIASVGAIITLALNFVLVPKIGYLGSAYSALACFGSMSVIAFAIGKKHFPVPYPVGQMILTLFIAWALYALNTMICRNISVEIIQLLISTSILSIFLGYIYSTQKNLVLEIFGIVDIKSSA